MVGGFRPDRNPPAAFQLLVFVVMIAMKGMLVAVVDVVHMVIMLDGFVPAAGSVLVLSRAMFGMLVFGGHDPYSSCAGGFCFPGLVLWTDAFGVRRAIGPAARCRTRK
jgi:hypothetical protein